MKNLQKNTQLGYIQDHFKWLIIISVVGVFIIIPVSLVTIYVGIRLYNAQEFHIEAHKIHLRLEAFHEE